jgi:hypothetical protein
MNAFQWLLRILNHKFKKKLQLINLIAVLIALLLYNLAMIPSFIIAAISVAIMVNRIYFNLFITNNIAPVIILSHDLKKVILIYLKNGFKLCFIPINLLLLCDFMIKLLRSKLNINLNILIGIILSYAFIILFLWTYMILLFCIRDTFGKFLDILVIMISAVLGTLYSPQNSIYLACIVIGIILCIILDGLCLKYINNENLIRRLS